MKDYKPLTHNFLQLGSASCMDKVKVCFLKAKEIHQYLYGDNHVKVGDCLYNLGLAFKKVLLFKPAQKHIEDAMKVYQVAVGIHSLQVANCCMTLAKIALMDDLKTKKALTYLEEALQMKQILYKHRPKCREIYQV